MEPNQNLNPQMPTQPNAGTPPVNPMPTQMAQSATQPTAAAPSQPTQPVPAPASPEQQIAAELEQAAAEDMAKAAAMKEAAEKEAALEAAKPKQSKGMVAGLVIACLVAVAGIGFGAYSMISSSQNIDSLNKQITTLKNTNSNLESQVADMPELTGEEALSLLSNAALSTNAGYKIAFANVYAVYTGSEDDEEDVTAYWVKYLPVEMTEGSTSADNIIFTLNDEGEWDFTLPGFVTYDSTFTANYELLNGEKVPANVVNSTETVVEEVVEE